MEVLRGGRGLADMDVVLARELEEALDARARVLGPLSFVAVREEQHEAGQKPPLVLARAEELVDDDLGAVREIAELRFPAYERVRIVAAEAVLEAERGGLGERRVVNVEVSLSLAEIRERQELPAVLGIEEHGVALV